MSLRDPGKPQRDARIDALGNDPRSVLILKDILRDINKDVQMIYDVVKPIQEAVRPIISGGGTGLAPEPTNLICVVGPETIFLSWTQSVSPAARGYEVRRSGDLVWDTASFVTRTPSLNVHLDPLPTGSYFFLIKTIDNFGNYSPNFAYTTATVVPPGKPTLTGSVIDNNVLLRWNNPQTSFTIDRYRIYRSGILFGASRASFTPIFETVAGSYTYEVEAIDIAGNVGERATITLNVSSPPDYQLQAERTSTLDSPTKDNVVKINGPALLACIDDPEFWHVHFEEDSWDQPSDQYGAGYPIYIQPTELAGWYEEIFDFGLVFQNTIATVTYQLEQLVPEVFATLRLSYSTDGISYSAPVAVSSLYIPSFRYLKVRIDFVALHNRALAQLTDLKVTLDVKREVDSGDVIARWEDVDGTWVAFHKDFKDVDSITVTADSIEPIICIYVFDDIPEPEGFYVFAMDSTGNRVTYLVSWKARGIV